MKRIIIFSFFITAAIYNFSFIDAMESTQYTSMRVPAAQTVLHNLCDYSSPLQMLYNGSSRNTMAFDSLQNLGRTAISWDVNILNDLYTIYSQQAAPGDAQALLLATKYCHSNLEQIIRIITALDLQHPQHNESEHNEIRKKFIEAIFTYLKHPITGPGRVPSEDIRTLLLSSREDTTCFSETTIDFNNSEATSQELYQTLETIPNKELITQLLCANCCLEKLDIVALKKKFSNLQHIDASGNLITMVEIPRPFTLTFLNLSNNNVTNFPRIECAEQITTATINLSHNLLSEQYKNDVTHSDSFLPAAIFSPHTIAHTLKALYCNKTDRDNFTLNRSVSLLLGTLSATYAPEKTLALSYASASILSLPGYYSAYNKNIQNVSHNSIASWAKLLTFPAVYWAIGSLGSHGTRLMVKKLTATQFKLPIHFIPILTGSFCLAHLLRQYIQFSKKLHDQHNGNKKYQLIITTDGNPRTVTTS